MNYPALISIQSNNGFPKLNGNRAAQDLVYPEAGIANMPCLFLGSANGDRPMFVFAAGAIPAHDNYATAKSTDQIGVSDAMEFLNDAASFEDDEIGSALKARLENATPSVGVFTNELLRVFGSISNGLNAVQIIAYSTNSEDERFTWASKVMDASGWTYERWRALLLPFLMADFIDELPEGVEVSGGNQPDSNMGYNAICLMIPPSDAQISGSYVVFGALLYGMFIANNGGSSWNIISKDKRSFDAYHSLVNGFSTGRPWESSLVWFSEMVQTYLHRNGKNWNSIWPNHLSQSGSPVSFVSQDIWENQFRQRHSSLINSIIRYARANIYPGARFKALMAEFADIATASSRQAAGDRRGGNLIIPVIHNTSNPSMFSAKSGLITELNGYPMPLILPAIRVGFMPWQERINAFREGPKLFKWIEKVAQTQITQKPTLYAIASWPLWRVILLHSPYGRMGLFRNKEITIRAKNILQFIEGNPTAVMQRPEACRKLVSYREWWIKASSSPKTKDMSVLLLDDILNLLRS